MRAKTRQVLHYQVLATLNRTNEWQDLVRDVLKKVKDFTGFDAVGIRLKEGDDFPYVVHNGFDEEFVRLENHLACVQDGTVQHDADGRPVLQCTCGLVLSGRCPENNPLFTANGSFWCNNTAPLLDLPPDQDPRHEPRNRCIHYGYESVALVPLRAGDETIGLLQLNDHQPDRLTLDLVQFFEGVGNSIGIAFARTQAEQESRQKQERYQSLVDNIPGISYRCKCDEDCTMLFMSDEVGSVTGYPASDFIKNSARSYESVIHPEDTAFVTESIHAAVAEGQPWSIEYRIRHKAGDIRWVHERGRRVYGEDGSVQYLDGVIIDITERKALEAELTRAQKLEAVGQLAAGIAHEINTPTQYIGDNTQFLQEAFDALMQFHTQLMQVFSAAQNGSVDKKTLAAAAASAEDVDIEFLSEQIPRAVTQSLEGVTRVADIVRAMKKFSHPGTREKAPADINEAVKCTATVCRNEWKYAADLEMQLAENMPRVPCLIGELNQVILNLIVNAAHAIGQTQEPGKSEKGLIVLRTDFDEEWAHISVSDTGCGIPDEVKHRVFDPFYTTKDVGKGTGQGLYIAHKVVADEHGGQITIDSSPGQGTTFTIRLPLHPSDAEEKSHEATRAFR
jgi:PAS domain S-box-containing protein